MFNIGTINYTAGGPTNGLLSGLVSYYEMDDGTDSRGSNNMTISGATTVTGLIGDAQRSDGVNDDMVTGTGIGKALTAFTFSLWVNSDIVPTGFEYCFRIINSSSQNLGYLGLYQSKFYAISGVGGTNGVLHPSSPTPTAGTYSHVVITQTGTTMTMYVDGTNVASTSSGTFTGTIDIMKTFSSASNFDGVIDEVGIWDIAIDQTKVDTLYNSGDGLSYSLFTS